MQKYDYDYIIIGGGPAGTAAAKALAKTKKKIAIVEASQWGGSYAYSRDVPYAAALNFSHLYARAMYGARFGISSTTLRYNYPTSAHWREKAVSRAVAEVKRELEETGVENARGLKAGQGMAEAVEKKGTNGVTKKDLTRENSNITMIRARAHFVGPHEIAIKKSDDGVITGRKILVATGVTPKDPRISGIETANCYTPETALKMGRVPKTVMVVGGGASGCEIAQYFAEIGSKVAMTEIAERILPREDSEVGEVLTEYFTKRFDVKVLTSARVVAVEQDAAGVKVIFVKDGKEKMVRVEAVVLATGSQPALDVGLENAGVNFTKGGIKVEKTLQTSQKHIFAAGDVISGDVSTEMAEYQGGLAAMNMAGRATNYANYNGFIRVTDTDPQIAVVGLTEDDAVKRSRKYKSAVIPLTKVPAANTQDFRMGFIKMLATPEGKIIGTTLMAPGAADAIQEVAVMIRHNFSILEIASTPHVAMGWSELVRQAARELARKK